MTKEERSILVRLFRLVAECKSERLDTLKDSYRYYGAQLAPVSDEAIEEFGKMTVQQIFDERT